MNRTTLGALCALWLLLPTAAHACPAHGQVGPAPAPPVAQGDAAEKRVTAEAFGPVRLGLTDAQLIKAIGAPAAKTPAVLEGATGQHVSDWKYPKLGLRLKMGADKKAGPFTVASFRLQPLCAYRSKHGVGIGSSAADIAKVYKGFVKPERSGQIIVGSEYLGLIFTMKGGKAVEIFVGAGAE